MKCVTSSSAPADHQKVSSIEFNVSTRTQQISMTVSPTISKGLSAGAHVYSELSALLKLRDEKTRVQKNSFDNDLQGVHQVQTESGQERMTDLRVDPFGHTGGKATVAQ
jgi:hypothetical protein